MHPDLQARLDAVAAELTAFLTAPERAAADQAELVCERIDQACRLLAEVEARHQGGLEDLRAAQQRFRDATQPALEPSWMMARARAWPQGYPGDYLMLERTYARAARSPGVGAHLDAAFQRQTLAVAVRSRLATLAAILRRRGEEEASAGVAGRWLNLACGSARELLDVPAAAGRAIACVDQDPDALAYAGDLLAGRGHQVEWQARNALRYVSAEATRRRHGPLTTIYSAGLFDYLPDEPLAALLAGLYGALAEGGLLVAAFKDAERYATSPYHWMARWHFFHQRTEPQFRAVLAQAGIPAARLELRRDASGVILFFLARR